jgi:hypothetical protein
MEKQKIKRTEVLAFHQIGSVHRNRLCFHGRLTRPDHLPVILLLTETRVETAINSGKPDGSSTVLASRKKNSTSKYEDPEHMNRKSRYSQYTSKYAS